MPRRRKKTHWWRPMLAIACILLGSIGVLIADVYMYSSASDPLPADAAIVLGAAAWNGRPSPVFEERINHAIDLYQQKKVKRIIFTGGVGDNDQRAESLVASDYAVKQGVAPKDMFCETTSRITLDNLQGAKEIVDQLRLDRVLVVSDPLHMRRSVTMARDLGLDAYPSPTPTSRYVSAETKLDFLLREVYYYGMYLIGKPFVILASDAEAMNVQPCR